jgi:NADPH:quinone reductase-like Zn-dependent oxidoreductase
MSEAKISPVAVNTEGATMMAAYVNEWCAIGTVPESISFGPVPLLGEPKESQVLIGIKAASMSGDDVALLQDSYAGGTAHSRKPSAAKPLVGGQDYAGVVLACGPGCTKLKVGDRVCGITKPFEGAAGTWAEQTVAPESEVCKIDDDSISFIDAAATAMGAFVGYDMMKCAATQLSGSARCLVIGASGSLGTVLLQMLRKKQAAVHITAVCSGKNADMVRGLGAHKVVDYTINSFAEQLAAEEKYDVAFDFVGSKEVERSTASVLALGGLYVTAVGPTLYMSKHQTLSCCETFSAIRYIMGKSLCTCGAKYKYSMSQAYPPLTAEMWRSSVIESGARAVVAEEVPFAEAPIREALRHAASNHAGGRVVINMESSALSS